MVAPLLLDFASWNRQIDQSLEINMCLAKSSSSPQTTQPREHFHQCTFNTPTIMVIYLMVLACASLHQKMVNLCEHIVPLFLLWALSQAHVGSCVVERHLLKQTSIRAQKGEYGALFDPEIYFSTV
jgi:hypothetical protein